MMHRVAARALIIAGMTLPIAAIPHSQVPDADAGFKFKDCGHDGTNGQPWRTAYGPSLSLSDRLSALKDETAIAEETFYKKSDAIRPLAEKDKAVKAELDLLISEFESDQRDRCNKAFQLAKSDPTSPVALDALQWLVGKSQSFDAPVVRDSFILAANHNAASPDANLGRLVHALASVRPDSPSFRASSYLSKKVSENPSPLIQGQLRFVAAKQAQWAYESAASKRSPNAEVLAQRAVEALAVLERPPYADLPFLGDDQKTTLRNAVKEDLRVIRTLRPLSPGPKFEGEALDGSKVLSSDFAGKVVVMVFWKSSCIPCLKNVAEERKLAEEMKGQPFIFLGVTLDEDLPPAIAAAAQTKMSWNSVVDKTSITPEGTLANFFNVTEVPQTVVFDKRGRIIAIGIHGQELRSLVKELVAEDISK